jgi:hypothetical protein
MTATRYDMDDATYQHLTSWCDRQYREGEAELKREQMANLLQSMSPEDAEYSLSHGWSHVANLL